MCKNTIKKGYQPHTYIIKKGVGAIIADTTNT